MSRAPDVAVVVPNWNSVELLERCVVSLQDQGVELETIVIDNGSDDGSLEYLRNSGVPHVSLPTNTGFAHAVNLGAAKTSAPAILVLNSDAILEPEAAASLLAALDADPNLGGVQPRILQLEGDEGPRDPERARLYSAGQGLTRDGRAVELGAGEAQSPPLLQRREVFGVCGAACLLRRGLFERLSGYDERYFAFCEDVDLNVRARIIGSGFEYVPEAVVWHVGNVTWLAQAPRPSAWNARLVARNRIATQAKFMPLGALPLILAVEAGALVRAARQGRFRATLRGKLEGLRLLPAMLRERRNLQREGELGRVREWLDASAAGPAPRGR